MKTVNSIIKKFIGKDLEIELNDEVQTLSIIDWKEISEKHEEAVKKSASMTESERDHFWSYNTSHLVNIYEYFLADEDIEDQVADGAWVPFAVIGMTNAQVEESGFAEFANGGMLLFDLTEDSEEPSILYILDGEVDTIASNFEELEIKVK